MQAITIVSVVIMLSTCASGCTPGGGFTRLQKECPTISGVGNLLLDGQRRGACVENFMRGEETRICNTPVGAERDRLATEYLQTFYATSHEYNLSNLPFGCKLADEFEDLYEK